VGKTSLLLELARRASSESIHFVVLDVMGESPVNLDLFRRYALAVADTLLGGALGWSLATLSRRRDDYHDALSRSDVVAALPSEVRGRLGELATPIGDVEDIRAMLSLPELLAAALDARVVIAVDEFQELASLAAGRRGFDPFPVMRSVWQRHERVAYVVSGSARTMLEELVSSRHSPFFQHFGVMELGPFEVSEAVGLLVGKSPPGRRIPKALAQRAVAVLGGHPFYLQLLGQTLTRDEPPYDDESFKLALQELLFNRTGRLSLYFEREYAETVGRSTYLAACLDALAEGPCRLTDVAKAIGATSGATAGYLERLGDTVKHEGKSYMLADPTFGLWLQWRRPGGSVVPMNVVGDEAERATARELARMGFELVYQSRASRGAFDLLATRGAIQLGLQVKRSALPLRFKLSEHNRMRQDAERFGWQWVVVAVSPDGPLLFLDPAKGRRGREWRLGEDAAIDNLLAWIERPPARSGAGRR
jgi:AAA+ ATPase superfamily predicted ATPase